MNLWPDDDGEFVPLRNPGVTPGRDAARALLGGVLVDERPQAPAVAPGDEAGQVLILDVAVGPGGELHALVDTDLGLVLVTV